MMVVWFHTVVLPGVVPHHSVSQPVCDLKKSTPRPCKTKK